MSRVEEHGLIWSWFLGITEWVVHCPNLQVSMSFQDLLGFRLSLARVLLVWDSLVHPLPVRQVHAAPYIVEGCRPIESTTIKSIKHNYSFSSCHYFSNPCCCSFFILMAIYDALAGLPSVGISYVTDKSTSAQNAIIRVSYLYFCREDDGYRISMLMINSWLNIQLYK
jgi:hypothetical protein